MPEPVKAVLFDYGLVLTGPADPVAWAEMLSLSGLDAEAYHAAYWAPRDEYDRGTHTGADYFRAVGRHAGVEFSEAQIASLLAADLQLWTRPNQPMIDFAGRLQAGGMRTGILSNLGDELASGVAALPWVAGFDHATWSHRLGLAKPEAAIYAHAARGLETAVQNILFIDDREDNIAGAQRAGIQTIRYTTQAEFERELLGRGLRGLWLTGRE